MSWAGTADGDGHPTVQPTDEPEVAIERKCMDTLGGDPGYPKRSTE